MLGQEYYRGVGHKRASYWRRVLRRSEVACSYGYATVRKLSLAADGGKWQLREIWTALVHGI
jgi:hypothetical protein